MLSTSLVHEQSPEPVETVPCPLCGGSSHELVMMTRDRLFARKGEYPMVRCTACDMQFLSPRPTLDALGVHYPLAYFPYKTIESEPPLIRGIARYFDDKHWKGMLHRIERVTGTFRPDSQVLDVGCGPNKLLALVQRIRGCTGTGVEFNPEVAAYIRDTLKMPCVAGTVHDGHFPDAHFDVVTMNGYLEHEPFPRRVLEETRRITKKGGYVSISVPMNDSLPARMFSSCWSQVDAPRHLINFTRPTLSKMLEATGFRVVDINSYSIPFTIGLSVLMSLGRRRLGSMGLFDTLPAVFFTLAMLPALPWLDEFMVVTGKAE